MLDYFYTSQATRPNGRGGARRGAGRKPRQHVRLQVYVYARVREIAQKLARSENTTLGTVIEKALLGLADGLICFPHGRPSSPGGGRSQLLPKLLALRHRPTQTPNPYSPTPNPPPTTSVQPQASVPPNGTRPIWPG